MSDSMFITVCVVCFVSGGAVGFISAVAFTIGRAYDSKYEDAAERDSKEA